MPAETSVQITLDSASVYAALLQQVEDWRLDDHEFDPETDEIRISYDSAGSGRVSVTVSFEFDAEQMGRILTAARPAD